MAQKLALVAAMLLAESCQAFTGGALGFTKTAPLRSSSLRQRWEPGFGNCRQNFVTPDYFVGDVLLLTGVECRDLGVQQLRIISWVDFSEARNRFRT